MKITFFDDNCDFFFSLRVAQTAIQLKNKYIMDCTTCNYFFYTFYIMEYNLFFVFFS